MNAAARRPARLGRLLPRPASLRGRVTLTALALLAVVVVVLFVAVDLALSARLNAEARTRLTDRAALATQLDGTLTPQQLVDRLRGDGVTAQLCTSGTSDCVVADPAPVPSRPPGPVGRPRGPVPPAAPPTSVQSAGSVLYVRATLAGGQVLTLSTDTTQISSALHRLVIFEAIGGVVALALAGLLLSRLSQIALRPLDDMTVVARQITAGDRGRRLHVTRSDTELGRTAAAFDGMLDELEAALGAASAAEARMRAFLGDASHELRTPLSGLRASAENLLRENPDRTERERIAVGMVRETQRASRLVEDLLAIARLDQGLDLRYEDVDLTELVRHELERARQRSTDLHFELHAPGRIPAPGDPVRLGQIIANLLDNACHATPPGGSITVEIAQQTNGASVVVADTGSGVPAAAREHIFERFARLDASRSRRTGGAGLGLPIARGLARAHGGDLAYLDRKGSTGAAFRLSLPVASSAQPDAQR